MRHFLIFYLFNISLLISVIIFSIYVIYKVEEKRIKKPRKTEVFVGSLLLYTGCSNLAKDEVNAHTFYPCIGSLEKKRLVI